MVPNAPILRSARSVRTARDLARAAIAGSMALLAIIPLHGAAAQSPGEPVGPPTIKSMGQPPLWQPYTSVVATFGRNNDATGGVELGLFHPGGSPVNGVFGLAAEGYLFASDGGATGAEATTCG